MPTQTALFDPNQYSQVQTEPIREIPLAVIEPDPNNPASYSDRYSKIIGTDINVEEEEVEKLVAKIGTNGYDYSAPIVVRPMPSGKFRLVRGHHTFVALWVLEIPFAPCIVRKMTDVEAEICLLTLQGRKVDDWYALKVVCHLIDRKVDPQTIAALASIDTQKISSWQVSYKFINKIVAEMNEVYPSFQKAIKVKDAPISDRDKRFSIWEAREIGLLPDEDQIWFVNERLARLADPMPQAKQSKLTSLLKNTKKQIDRSPRWKQWLRWDVVREEIYKEFDTSSKGESDLANSIPELLQEAEDHFNNPALPLTKDYFEIGKGAKKKTGLPKDEFVQELIRLSDQNGYWDAIDIRAAFKSVVEFYDRIEKEYIAYLQKQAADKISKSQQIITVSAAEPDGVPLTVNAITGQIEVAPAPVFQANIEERTRIFNEFSPQGFNDSLISYSQSTDITYPVILTTVGREDWMIDEFFENCDRLKDMLTENGVLAIACPSDLSFAIIDELESRCTPIQRLYLRPIDKSPVSKYSKPIVTLSKTSSRSPFIRPQECEHLLVFTRRSDTPIAEYGLQVAERGDVYKSLVTIFCDQEITFLDPFCSNGMMPYWAKTCGFKCHYLVSNSDMFPRIKAIAEQATFPGSLFKGV